MTAAIATTIHYKYIKVIKINAMYILDTSVAVRRSKKNKLK